MDNQAIVAFDVAGGAPPVLVEESVVTTLKTETQHRGYTTRRISRGPDEIVVGQASQSLESAVEGIRPAARAMLDQFVAIGREVRKVELELGIKLSAEAGAIIAKTAAEGHCIVRLTFIPGGGEDA